MSNSKTFKSHLNQICLVQYGRMNYGFGFVGIGLISVYKCKNYFIYKLAISTDVKQNQPLNKMHGKS